MSKEKSLKIDGIKRLIAALTLGSFISALNPFALSAQSFEQNTNISPSQIEKEEKVEVLIKASEGGTITLGQASIEIPSGALKNDTTISITHLSKVADTGESLCNVIPDSGGYRFLPAGTKF